MSAEDESESDSESERTGYRGTRVSAQQMRTNAAQMQNQLAALQGGRNGTDSGLRLNNNPMKGSDYRRSLGMFESSPQPTVWDAVNYPDEEEFEFESFYIRYERQPEAAAVIDKPVNDTWQDGPIITDKGSDGNEDTQTDFEEKVGDLLSGDHTRRKPIHRLKTLDKLARLGHYAVMVIGFSDGRDLKTPVGGVSADAQIDDDGFLTYKGDTYDGVNVPDDMSDAEFDSPDDVLYLAVFGEDRVIDISTNSDMTSARFRLPESFDLVTEDDDDNDENVSASKYDTKNVHWTRAIHAPEGTLEDDLSGIPALKPVFHELLNIDKIRAASGEGYWRAGYQGLHVRPPQDAQGKFMEFENDGEDVATEIREFIENFDRTLATPAQIEPLDNSVGDPNPHLDANYEAISAATDIPKSILTGQDRADTADMTDLTKYERMIASRRNNYATPRIVKPFIQRLIDTGVLPEPEGEGFEVSWPSLEELTETQEWNLKLTKANAIRNIAPGGDTSMFATVPELRKIIGFPPNVGGSVDDDKLEGEQEEEMPNREPLGQSAAGQAQGGNPQTAESNDESESNDSDTQSDMAPDETSEDVDNDNDSDTSSPTMSDMSMDEFEFPEEIYNRPVEAERRAAELGLGESYHIEMIDGNVSYIPGPGPDELRSALVDAGVLENTKPQREARESIDVQFG